MIKVLKEAIRLCHRSKIPMFLWGHHGVGKSSIYSQVADELGIGYVDFRAAQIEATDLRGYPKENEGRTIYCPPIELPVESPENSPEKIIEIMKKLNTYHKEGIIVFDELNRAQDPVIQASFQLFVEGRIGTWIKPEGWSCMAAGNFGNSYNVNDFCQAFIGRFCHVVLSIDEEYLSEWASHMLNKHGNDSITQRVIQFVTSDITHISQNFNSDLGFIIQRSPRIWDQVIKMEKEAKNGYSEDAILIILNGLIGDMATTYRKATFEILPKDILEKGEEALKGKKIDRSILSGLIHGIIALAENYGKKIKKEQIANIMKFAAWMCDGNDADLAIVICQRLLIKTYGNFSTTILSNPNMSAMIDKDPWITELMKCQKVQELVMKLFQESAK